MSTDLWLIGCGRVFETIAVSWAAIEPETVLHVVRLDSPDNIAEPFEGRIADATDDAHFFAAVDQNALNFARLDLYARLRLNGHKFRSLQHPTAAVDPAAQIGENCWIGAHALIGAGAKLGHNTFVETAAIVLEGADVGANAWIGAAARVGTEARLGTHCVVGSGVSLASGITIGRYCSIERPGHYSTPLADRTYIDPLFENPVYIFQKPRPRPELRPD